MTNSILSEWTAESAKEQLPMVKVDYGKGIILDAHTCGRMNDFCKVWFRGLGNGEIVEASFSWEAIANSLNSNKPLPW